MFLGGFDDLGRVFGFFLCLNANVRPFMPEFAPLCPLFAFYALGGARFITLAPSRFWVRFCALWGVRQTV